MGGGEIIFFRGLLLGGGGGPIRSYNVKEKHIGSAVRVILRYRQTDTYPVTFILRIIMTAYLFVPKDYV